jgi:hypothetical protein
MVCRIASGTTRLTAGAKFTYTRPYLSTSLRGRPEGEELGVRLRLGQNPLQSAMASMRAFSIAPYQVYQCADDGIAIGELAARRRQRRRAASDSAGAWQ